jgi:hypothetical protein
MADIWGFSGVFLGLDRISGFRRRFSLNDESIQYPYVGFIPILYRNMTLCRIDNLDITQIYYPRANSKCFPHYPRPGCARRSYAYNQSHLREVILGLS